MIQEAFDRAKELVGKDLVAMGFTEEQWAAEKEECKQRLGSLYEGIIAFMKQYIDLQEDYYHLIAIWIIGTYFHKQFSTYPFLFLNATKGSGKTRTLRIISYLQKGGDGSLLNNPSEPVIFRTAQKTGLIFDEFEDIGKKESQVIREILNAAYKKGGKVVRMRKKYSKEGEEQVAEAFDLYTPVAMANIWGMDDVLGDRCINLVLERSNNTTITRLIEDFDTNKTLKELIRTFSVVSAVYIQKKMYIEEWNTYVSSRTNYTNNTTYIHNSNSTNNSSNNNYYDELEMFNKIFDSGIEGRALELYFPLLIISHIINEDCFKKTLEIATKLTDDKKQEDVSESRDIITLDFLARLNLQHEASFNSLNVLAGTFRSFVGEVEEDDRWVTAKWLGRALKRMNLIIDKRRMSKGVEVRIAIEKAKSKLNLYRKGTKNGS